MALLPSDYSLIGIVLAIALAIILLSGLGLYVAFRVKETLREERGRGAKAAKVAFLIGLLFLSGGVFFFFASGVNSLGGHGTSTSSTTFATSSSSSFTTTHGNKISSSTGITTTVVTTTVVSTSSSLSTSSTTSAQGSLNMTPSFPSSETAGSTFFGSFTILNNGSTAANSVSIQVGNLFNQFVFQSCSLSINGGASQDCTSSVTGSGVSVGNAPSGTTIITLGLKAPSQPGQFSDTVTIYYFLGSQGSSATTVTIHVTA